MNYLSARFLAALTVSSLITAGQVRADFMNWSYTTNSVPTGFSVTAPGGSSAGGGTIQLTPFGTTAGASTINVLAYTTTATAPVTFNAATSTYTLTMTITDNTTSDSKSLTFTGSIGGGLNPTGSTLVNTFANPTQSMTLDGHMYTVTVPSSVALAPPGPQQNITATVSVSNVTGPGGGGVGTPEPASLVLGTLGFSLFGMSSLCNRFRRPTPRMA
jgi:hypothetical protein